MGSGQEVIWPAWDMIAGAEFAELLCNRERDILDTIMLVKVSA